MTTKEELSEKLDTILEDMGDSYIPVTNIRSGMPGYCLVNVNPGDKNDILFVPEHPSDLFQPPTEVSWCEVTPRLSTTRNGDFMEFISRAFTKIGMPGKISIPASYFKPEIVIRLIEVKNLLKELDKQGGQQ